MKKIVLIVVLFVGTSVFSQNYKFGKVTENDFKESESLLDSLAPAEVLFSKKNVLYEYNSVDGWRLVTEIHKRIKINTKKGFKYATHSVSLYQNKGTSEIISGLKGYTYVYNGNKIAKEKLKKKSIFKEKSSDSWKNVKFTMPSIKEGVIIEFKYSISSPFYHFIDNVVVQEDIPVKKLEVTLEIPEYFVFKKEVKGYLPVAIKQSRQSRTINYSYRQGKSGRAVGKEKVAGSVDLGENVFIIEKENIPALKEEPFVSNINNYRSEVVFELTFTKFPNSQVKTYATTWKDVTKTIYKSISFGRELNKENYFKNDVSALLKNAKTDGEKIMTIFQYVKSKVKWDGNAGKYTKKGVKKAYKEGVGNVADINLMLTAMLRFAGLNANPVLVSTRGNGAPIFPTLKGYNYVVSSVIFQDGKYILLDATEKYATPNILPVRALNWEGRVVKKGGDSFTIPLETNKHATENNKLNVKITDDGDAEGFLISVFENHDAFNFRRRYNPVKEEEIRSELEEKYNIEIDALKIINKNDILKPVVVRLKFTSEDLLEEIGNKIYINPLLFLANTKNPFKSIKRNFPIDFKYPLKELNTIVIKIPENYSIVSHPTSFAVALPENLGIFKYIIKAEGKTIRVSTTVQINRGVIPQDYYPELKEFFNKFTQKQSEKIVIEKK